MPGSKAAPYLEIVKDSTLDGSSLESHLAAIVESSDDAIISKSLEGTILSWNRGAEQLYGYGREQAVGQPIFMIVPDELHDEVRALLGRVAEGERVEHHDTRRRRADGTIVEVSLTISPIRNPDGVIVAASVIARDITERRALAGVSAHLAAIVESSDDAIISKSLEGTILSWNRGAEQLYGYGREQAVGQPIFMIVPDELHDEVRALLGRVAEGERVEHHDTRRRRADGTIVEVSLTISPIRNPDGVIVAASVIARDITERKHLERQLIRIASEDQLTGLSNRHVFMRFLDRHLDNCVSQGWRGALMLIDIDSFKAINDTLGHGAGDQIIKQTAARLRLGLKSGDVLARLGGDEFAVLLPDADVQRATACANRIVAELAEQEITIAGQRCATASLGWTSLNESMTSEEALIRADLAGYKAKGAGGNRAESFSSTHGTFRLSADGHQAADGPDIADLLGDLR